MVRVVPAAIDLGFFFPASLVVPALACAALLRRWSLLLLPAALWLVPGLLAAIRCLTTGRGNPLVMLGLWGLYLPIPLGFVITVGVALGRAAARRCPRIARAPEATR